MLMDRGQGSCDRVIISIISSSSSGTSSGSGVHHRLVVSRETNVAEHVAAASVVRSQLRTDLLGATRLVRTTVDREEKEQAEKGKKSVK